MDALGCSIFTNASSPSVPPPKCVHFSVRTPTIPARGGLHYRSRLKCRNVEQRSYYRCRKMSDDCVEHMCFQFRRNYGRGEQSSARPTSGQEMNQQGSYVVVEDVAAHSSLSQKTQNLVVIAFYLFCRRSQPYRMCKDVRRVFNHKKSLL
jgi:hypothetical protein